MVTSSIIFSYYVGSLALLGSVISSILFCRHYFPSVRIKVLQEVYHDTKDLYEQVRGEGLLPSSYAEQVEVTLKRLEYTTISLRDTTYKCTNSAEEAIAALQGLSRAIGKVVLQVKQLRAKIVTVSEEQRRARGQADSNTPNEPSSVVPIVEDSGRESVVNSDTPSILPVINVPRLPGHETPSRITGFLAYGPGASGQVPAPCPEPDSDTASATETLIGRGSDWGALRLWQPFPRWGRFITKGNPVDVESGPIPDVDDVSAA